jgi:hypothetical protein
MRIFTIFVLCVVAVGCKQDKSPVPIANTEPGAQALAPAKRIVEREVLARAGDVGSAIAAATAAQENAVAIPAAAEQEAEGVAAAAESFADGAGAIDELHRAARGGGVPKGASVRGCPAGNCEQTCESGKTCNFGCAGAKCTQTCEQGATCVLACAGGACTQTCKDGSTCSLTCAGGGCTQSCEGACKKSCAGGGCE